MTLKAENMYCLSLHRKFSDHRSKVLRVVDREGIVRNKEIIYGAG